MDEMNLKSAMKENCLKFIKKIRYARNETEYDGLYRQFLAMAPADVKTYYNNNWHPIREEWVTGFKLVAGNFLNGTNNRLESINGKLKQVVDKYSSLEFFIEQFFIILPFLRNERQHRAVYSQQKRPVVPYVVNSPEKLYSTHLTEYALRYVIDQLDLFSSTTFMYTFSPDVNQ